MFWKAAQNAPLQQQNQTSSEAAPETPTDCSRRQQLTLHTSRAQSQAQRASWRLPRDCPLSFLPREIRPDGSTPSLCCRGEPGTPKRVAAPGRAQLQPPLAPPAKRRSLVTKFGSGTEASRPWAAAPTGRRCALPLPRRRVRPSPGGRSCGRCARAARPRAFAVRWPGGDAGSRAACEEEAGARVEAWSWRLALR